ncbi:hypothetical protein KDA06_01140 [Candidatus Saccharibacteria bacterium]|jgi:hypothetical protein|nr:hypothetical protein [Candidatus Saccharibacteria bacterium]
MARYIRLYNTPEQTSPGSILGFSLSLTEAAYDPFLHDWLNGRGYTVTEESDAQKAEHTMLPKIGDTVTRCILQTIGVPDIRPSSLDVNRAVPNAGYFTAPGIPLPDDTVSASHLLIEPPLRDEDLQPLGLCLSSLAAVDDQGLRKHFFVDSRDTTPKAYSRDEVIYAWGQTF